MGWFSKLFGAKKRKTGPAAFSLFDVLGDPSSGTDSSAAAALRLPAVWAAASFLSETIAGLPFQVVRYDGEARDIQSHRVSSLLNGMVNPAMTGFAFKQSLMMNLLFRGRAIVRKLKDQSGRLVGLVPINPDRCEVQVFGVQKYYKIEGQEGLLPSSDVFDILGMTLDGVTPLSLLEYHAETNGLAHQVRKFSRKYFGQGQHSTRVIKTPPGTTKEHVEAYKVSLLNSFAGLENTGKPVVLPPGFELEAISLSAKDAVLIEALNFSILDVARVFRVPPHILGDLTKSSYASIEAQGQEVVTYTLAPWITRLEQSLTAFLFSPEEQGTYQIKINTAALVRADVKTRYEVYTAGITAGILTPNEARAFENLAPKDGGDTLRFPLNTAPAARASKKPVRALAAQPELFEQRSEEKEYEREKEGV